MFGVFLKAKLEIEAKLSHLQTFYLQLLRSPIAPILWNDFNNIDKASEILKVKLKTLEDIKEEYTTTLLQYEETNKALLEAKETSEDLEYQLDQLFELFGLEIPVDLMKKERSPLQDLSPELIITEREIEEEGYDEDKENSQIYQEFGSDKEILERSECLSDSEEQYFSPNIQIRKSIGNVTADCYTPAVKSHSKSARQF